MGCVASGPSTLHTDPDMHPLLRTLDLTAGAGLASSVHDLHPIGQAAPPRARTVAILFSLGLTPLLIYGLANGFINPATAQDWRKVVDPDRKSVSFLLQEPDTPGIRPPRPEPPGAGGTRRRRSPGGHRHPGSAAGRLHLRLVPAQ